MATNESQRSALDLMWNVLVMIFSSSGPVVAAAMAPLDPCTPPNGLSVHHARRVVAAAQAPVSASRAHRPVLLLRRGAFATQLSFDRIVRARPERATTNMSS
jgi:hypothetical protein